MDTWSFVAGHWQPGDLPAAEVRWFDVCGAGDRQFQDLARELGLHALAIEDCLSPLVHAPKIDEFSDHLFVVFHALVPGPEGPATEELDVFLGARFLITYQDERVPATAAMAAVLAEGITVRPGADGLLYEIADRAVDAILPQVSGLGERLDDLQREVLRGDLTGDPNAAILSIRSHAGQIRRLLLPQLTVTQRLSRGEFSQVAESNRIYFRDIYDHLVRIDLALEGLREDAEVALTTYLSAINNRLSEVMKVLSVVGALALPASVIAGIFGTNFDNVPGLHSNWGFVAMLAAMGSLAISMAWYFRRRRWF